MNEQIARMIVDAYNAGKVDGEEEGYKRGYEDGHINGVAEAKYGRQARDEEARREVLERVHTIAFNNV